MGAWRSGLCEVVIWLANGVTRILRHTNPSQDLREGLSETHTDLNCEQGLEPLSGYALTSLSNKNMPTRQMVHHLPASLACVGRKGIRAANPSFTGSPSRIALAHKLSSEKRTKNDSQTGLEDVKMEITGHTI